MKQDFKRAYDYELQASKLGLMVSQMTCLSMHLKKGFDLGVDTDTKCSWYFATLAAYQNTVDHKEHKVFEDVEQLLRNIPEPYLEKCLEQAFKKIHLQEFRILSRKWSAQDTQVQEVLDFISDGNFRLLRQALINHTSLVDTIIDGHNLVHIAAEQAQVEILQCKANFPPFQIQRRLITNLNSFAIRTQFITRDPIRRWTPSAGSISLEGKP